MARRRPIVAQSSIPAKEPHSPIEPPLTSLDFNISKDLFQAALEQPKDSPGSFWSHTMYKSTSTDGTTQNVKVHYCTSKQTMEHVCQKYFRNQPVLGFDLEWVAYAKRQDGPRENVSLIQMASPGRIGLFHVAMFPKDDFVAPTFRAIMEDSAVEKVGVHIQADCTRLRNFLGVKTRGIFELSQLYKLLKHVDDEQRRKLINKVPVALATQVQEVLKLPLFKGQSVRSSNWSKPLTSKQLTYSAADAYAGLQLYHVLEERRLAMDPPPDRPRHAELGLPIPIPPTPVVSDVESDLDSDLESVEYASSELSDGSIEEAMQELALGEASTIVAQPPVTTADKQAARRDARIEAAEVRIAQRRASRPGGRLLAAPSSLRAFFVWQANEDMTPADVARLLRDPPLQTGTVIGYILDAIRAEKLAFRKERLRTEVLSLLHPALANGKYRAIVKQCEQTET
ncbi:Ribonuclease H-like protein [Akanthomyces lecanii RCEF 1005]|uniref:Ribonuclease H-like protein n=1 Tax=Akanthomyces lecanii RCEF 1005 TaxID=1081108 RepID=A0A168FT84_CORDF|nr:Ribonuclease H-like protein [Akanthomyces lecanii RCEF 1005]